MYYLDEDKESTILPARTEIIDLEECKVDDHFAAFNRMDTDFKVPLTFGKVLVNEGIDLDTHISKDIKIDGISVEFSRLDTRNEHAILDFSKRYGLLGLGRAINNLAYLDDRRENHLYIKGFRYEETYVEPLKLWKWHIKHVHKLLQLARALSKEHRGMSIEIEENLLYVDDPLFPKHMVSDLNQGEFTYQWVYWYDREYTTVDIVRSDYSFKKVARQVLITNISSMLNGAINIEPNGFVEDRTSKYGFKIQDSRSTNFLLAAIYYDLWHTITKNESVKMCMYEKCGKAFHAIGRKKYCSNNCRVNDFNYQKSRSVTNIG